VSGNGHERNGDVGEPCAVKSCMHGSAGGCWRRTSNGNALAAYLQGDKSMALKRVGQKVCMVVWPASPARMVNLEMINRSSAWPSPGPPQHT